MPIKEILRYCFNHCDHYDACKEIVRVVEQAVLYSRPSAETQYVTPSPCLGVANKDELTGFDGGITGSAHDRNNPGTQFVDVSNCTRKKGPRKGGSV